MKKIFKFIFTTTVLLSSLPVFAQNGETDTVQIAEKNSDVVFTSVEQMPEYPGGIPALTQFLGSVIEYPKAAKQDNIQGKVIVRFVVDTVGNIQQVTALRDIGGGCGEEAVRAVRAMPRWKPGRKDGIPVRVYYTLPVTFKLGR